MLMRGGVPPWRHSRRPGEVLLEEVDESPAGWSASRATAQEIDE